jgi:hypothetical protein
MKAPIVKLDPVRGSPAFGPVGAPSHAVSHTDVHGDTVLRWDPGPSTIGTPYLLLLGTVPGRSGHILQGSPSALQGLVKDGLGIRLGVLRPTRAVVLPHHLSHPGAIQPEALCEGLVHHPPQRELGQPAIFFRMSATHIAVRAGKPHLVLPEVIDAVFLGEVLGLDSADRGVLLGALLRHGIAHKQGDEAFRVSPLLCTFHAHDQTQPLIAQLDSLISYICNGDDGASDKMSLFIQVLTNAIPFMSQTSVERIASTFNINAKSLLSNRPDWSRILLFIRSIYEHVSNDRNTMYFLARWANAAALYCRDREATSYWLAEMEKHAHEPGQLADILNAKVIISLFEAPIEENRLRYAIEITHKAISEYKKVGRHRGVHTMLANVSLYYESCGNTHEAMRNVKQVDIKVVPELRAAVGATHMRLILRSGGDVFDSLNLLKKMISHPDIFEQYQSVGCCFTALAMAALNASGIAVPTSRLVPTGRGALRRATGATELAAVALSISEFMWAVSNSGEDALDRFDLDWVSSMVGDAGRRGIFHVDLGDLRGLCANMINEIENL